MSPAFQTAVRWSELARQNGPNSPQAMGRRSELELPKATDELQMEASGRRLSRILKH
jgi:hypothetical protein